MIAIFDLKTGNISSLKNVLDYLNIDNYVCDNPDKLNKAAKIIIPGVGSFDNFMLQLKFKDTIDHLKYQILTKEKPFLGICMGMQILLESSEEGIQKGLGFIKGRVKKLDNKLNNRIPHMGLNFAEPIKDNNLISSNKEIFYFLHSYYSSVEEDCVIATTNYGNKFPSIIGKKNIFGVQFHPEKSQKSGKILLENFNKL
jgi:imidazole glycerol-phosphate synthase subunit HisH